MNSLIVRSFLNSQYLIVPSNSFNHPNQELCYLAECVLYPSLNLSHCLQGFCSSWGRNIAFLNTIELKSQTTSTELLQQIV